MSDPSAAPPSPGQYPTIAAWDLATQVPRSGGRRPPRWLPNGGLAIPAASSIIGNGHQGWVQLAPQRPGRHDITIVNLTNQPAFLSSVQASTNPITLAGSSAWELDTEGEVWGWSLNGTSVDIVETLFPLIVGAGSAITPGGALQSIEPLVNW